MQTSNVNLPKLTIQRGNVGVGRPSLIPAVNKKLPVPKTLDFSKVRPQVAALLSVPEASLPNPTPAQSADQPGNSVRVSFDTAPTKGVVVAHYPQAFVRQDPRGSPVAYAQFEASNNPGYVYWWIPAVPNAYYLLTCYVSSSLGPGTSSAVGGGGGGTVNNSGGVGSNTSPTGNTPAPGTTGTSSGTSSGTVLSSIRYDIWDGVGGLQGQQTAVQSLGQGAQNWYQGVFMIGYLTSANSSLLSAVIYMPNDRGSTLDWCDVMRVK